MSNYFEHVGHDQLETVDIDVPERLRELNNDYVDGISTSIQEHGQLQPIEVVKNPRKKGAAYSLVSGAHRLAACIKLEVGVRANILSFKGAVSEFDDACRLREVDENLIRHELNPLDRAVFLSTRKGIYETLFPETKNGAQGGRGAQTNENETLTFSKNTAEQIGLGERTIQRACRIAEKIPPEIRKQLSGSLFAHKEGELYNLTKHGPKVQAAIVEQLFADKNPARSVNAAIKIIAGGKGKAEAETSADDADYKRLMTSWRQAPKAAQDRFLAFLSLGGVLDNIEEVAERVNAAEIEARG